MKDSRHLKNQLTDIIYYQIKTEEGDRGAERQLAEWIADRAMTTITNEFQAWTAELTNAAFGVKGN